MTHDKGLFKTSLLNRFWLSDRTFEMEFTKPEGFSFIPGQRIRFVYGSFERDYSLASDPKDSTFRICVRRVEHGKFSSILHSAEMHAVFQFSGPHGYFTFNATKRTPVWVATGTGIAPFASMTHSGIRDFILIHGVGNAEDLYYSGLFQSAAKQYIPCVSNPSDRSGMLENYFKGRITDYIKAHLEQDSYEFYLCGRSEMVRDVTLLVDDHFPGSYVHTEIFY